MPKKIKPAMSNDMLQSFDCDIETIRFDDGYLEMVIVTDTHNLYQSIILDEKDLEDMLTFLRRNK